MQSGSTRSLSSGTGHLAQTDNSFHPVDERDLNAIRAKVASDLRTAVATVKDERHVDFAGSAGVVASRRGDGTFSARENDCWR